MKTASSERPTALLGLRVKRAYAIVSEADLASDVDKLAAGKDKGKTAPTARVRRFRRHA